MKLRTYLFFGLSVQLLVALLGLLIGLACIQQSAKHQQYLISHHQALMSSQHQLQQQLEVHAEFLIQYPQSPLAVLLQARQHLLETLSQAQSLPLSPSIRQAYSQVAAQYDQIDFSALAMLPADQPPPWVQLHHLPAGLQQVRQALGDLQRHLMEQLLLAKQQIQQQTQFLSYLLAGTCALMLLLGFISAHHLARRTSAPMEMLSAAADSIRQGQFNITLPNPKATELASLSHHFGLMAQALEHFQRSNIEALLKGRQRLQAVLDSIHDGLVIIDRQGLLEHANPVAHRQLGWTPDQPTTSLGQLLDNPQLDVAIHHVLAYQPPPQLPDIHIQVAGEPRVLSAQLGPVQHPDGSISGAVMVLHDITHQRSFEQARREFVQRASHELRTPLTGLQMAFGLLYERQPWASSSREAELMETVREEMQRLIRLLNDLLEFSRYQNGQHSLRLQACQARELLQKVSQEIAATLANDAITIHVDCPSELPEITVDIQLLTRTLEQLLNNAFRHSPSPGQVQLRAWCDQQWLVIAISDKGCGIPYAEQKHIFEPFVQVGPLRGRTGMGLVLSQEIIRLHGGHISLHSVPDQGTCFQIRLPLCPPSTGGVEGGQQGSRF